MTTSFSDKVNRAWYEGGLWVFLLAPLSLLYSLILFIKSCLHKPPQKTNIPVIVVGNITVGGTGKSPLVSYLVAFFQNQGYRVGVVSRGYGVPIPKTEVRMVQSDSSANVVGDEPLMLKRLLHCDIALCPTRALAVKALEDLACELIISDDGLQHHAMYRDLEVCVIDGARGLGNGWLMPVGPLREPKSRLSKVDAVVVNGKASDESLSKAFLTQTSCPSSSPLVSYMQLSPSEFEHVESGEIRSIEDFLADINVGEYQAIAGIGNPKRFFDTLNGLGLSCDTKGFPDHYAYGSGDFPDPQASIVMTEKDAAKCRGLGLNRAWFLRVRPELQDKLADNLYNQLIAGKRLLPKASQLKSDI